MKILSIGTEITANTRGQTITGTVKKLNRTTCVIKVTGGNTRFPIGHDVKCPYSIITVPFKCGDRGVEANAGYGIKALDDMTNKINDMVKPPFTPTKFWAKQNANALVLLGHVFSGLSPENLSCDGEASRAWINKRLNELNRQWDACTLLMGGTRIEEDQYYNIMGEFGEDIKAALEEDGKNVIQWYHYYKPKTEKVEA
jgi:hypothetical protein